MIGKEKGQNSWYALSLCVSYTVAAPKKSDNAIYKCRTKWTKEKKKKKCTPEQFHQHKIVAEKKGKIVEER